MSKNPATIGGDFTEGLGTVRENGRINHTPSFSDDGIGFRVVHDDSYRVLRGGWWYDLADNERAANRDWGNPGRRSGSLGLRLVKENT